MPESANKNPYAYVERLLGNGLLQAIDWQYSVDDFLSEIPPLPNRARDSKDALFLEVPGISIQALAKRASIGVNGFDNWGAQGPAYEPSKKFRWYLARYHDDAQSLARTPKQFLDHCESHGRWGLTLPQFLWERIWHEDTRPLPFGPEGGSVVLPGTCNTQGRHRTAMYVRGLRQVESWWYNLDRPILMCGSVEEL